MAKGNKQKEQEHHNDLLENPEALADQLSKTEQFVENNKTLVLGIGILLLLLVGGYFGFETYKKSQNEKAQNEMFQAIYYFESDSLDLALNGDGINLGFKDIIDEYSITSAANLANFYAGAAYLKQGDFKSALLYLEDFSADDLLIQARAYSLMGDANMELENYSKAAELYKKAASYKENKQFSPRYLMKAALAYEYAENIEAAKESYETVINEYWDSSEVQNAKKYKARLEKSAS
ncbi:tetratricopeptide repeat protein [Fulvivirga lutea]|uniref:Tetratricopeptide repeat protein n=1 Tax=Fulvivirga lutea TaxID=2810512 RepID=A0A974WHW0_9BACT|nr:tetratricopeptide repeat protein [Fulvivirga lutea]QSE97522.1 tetratricopeptide repeat protein [Fulvivirga lutea]